MIARFMSGFQKMLITLISLIGATILGLLGWYGYKFVDTRQRVQKLQHRVKAQKQTITRLKTEMKLLKTDHRVARLTVLEQFRPEHQNQIHTRIRFSELNEKNEVIDSPRTFTVKSPVVYVDGWIVKFKDKFIQKEQTHRSSSMLLFRRIYGQKQSPESGSQLDRPGNVPKIYHPSDASNHLIDKIWSDFWKVANDRKQIKEYGIRAIHGTTGYMKVEPGRTYRVSLRSSGDISIVPIPEPDQ